MHDDDLPTVDAPQRKLYAMPVASDNRRKAASKKTYRSARAGRKVAKVIGGKHKRRHKRWQE